MERFKHSLMASGNVKPSDVWPEWFDDSVAPDSPEAKAAEERGEAFEDLSGVEWVSPSDGADFDELLRLQAELNDTAISVSEGDEGGDWV